MERRLLTLDRMSIAVSVEPIYWELLQTRGARRDMTIDLYVELNAPTRNPEKLARWIRTTCVGDLRETLAERDETDE
ncbi:hypothetical protein [Azospirillum sp.]|uniref:hypothetical protein n=1 Tax=Azospirillum sp. TaxID=34012 RepID=UPI002D450F60|nr:hypothetical protein [Azospirillum sp.]HYF88099.1 hypothetical protein [Azospirillum sp.]